MSTIRIRQAALDDLDAIVPLFDAYRQFYGQPSNLSAARDFLDDRLQGRESVVFLAFDGERAVGFTQLYPSFSSVSLAPILILNDLYVDARDRKSGVGTKLLAAAVDYGRTMGVIRLTLTTATTNLTAQSVYEAAGWKRDAEFFVYHFAIPG